jgi:hypothetical protein
MFNELALPEAGGVLDQDERIVRMLEIVHDEVMAIRKDELDSIKPPQKPTPPGVDSRKVENISIGNTTRKVRG